MGKNETSKQVALYMTLEQKTAFDKAVKEFGVGKNELALAALAAYLNNPDNIDRTLSGEPTHFPIMASKVGSNDDKPQLEPIAQRLVDAHGAMYLNLTVEEDDREIYWQVHYDGGLFQLYRVEGLNPEIVENCPPRDIYQLIHGLGDLDEWEVHYYSDV